MHLDSSQLLTLALSENTAAPADAIESILRTLHYRRARTLPDQIKQLKAELPPKDKEGNRPSSPQLEAEIADLEKVSPVLTSVHQA